MVKAIVGAGGKTSLIKRYVKEYREQGLKVFVTTSTHMFIEEDTLLTDDAEIIIQTLEEKGYAMAGVPIGSKIGALSEETYKEVCTHADVVLVEADGSKHMPIKFPNSQEPVIYDNVDEIIVVYGLHALGRKAKDAAHRLDLVKKCLQIEDDTIINASHIQKLVRKGYVEPLGEKYPDKKIVIYANQYNSAQTLPEKKWKIGCVMMASGLGMRFGGNKLMADFHGKSMFELVLELTGGDLFEKRVVVTRNEQVRDLCYQRGIEVIFHEFPDRNDTVRLGIAYMEDMDGCMFCPCDQPLLKRESLIRLCARFAQEKNLCEIDASEAEKKIFRLGFGEKQGAPVLFEKACFQELRELPQKKGGSYLIKKYPNRVSVVEAVDEWELFDIDTQEDFQKVWRAAEIK